MSELIRLALADDQALVRRGLRVLLDGYADFKVVIEAEDGQALLSSLLESEVDLALCDIRMPRLDGINLVTRLRQGANRLPVILLTTFEDPELSRNAAECGANGFLLKDAQPDELADAIRKVAAGGRYFQPQTVSGLRSQLPGSEHDFEFESLDDREIDIVRLMASGLSNREIAERLFLAEGTVKNRVSTILSKLNARDRTQAVLRAITHGLV